MDTTSCMALASVLPIRTLAIYSHLVPAAIGLFLGLYAYIATKYSRLSSIFVFFILAVDAWLVGDALLWTFPGYDTVMFFWSWLDFINIVFFVLGVYFFAVLARGSISRAERFTLIILIIPAFLLTLLGHSVTDFYQPTCEAIEGSSITLYKLFVEGVCILLIAYSLVRAWKASDRTKRMQLSLIALAVTLFFAVFSVTEYIASVTNVYEINLYGLFTLPLFLVVMVFAITNLEVFKIRYLGAQLLIYILIILIASQFLFLQSSTDALLNGITLALSVIIGAILLQNQRQQLGSLVQIEGLAQQLSEANVKLRDLDQLKSQFVSFASHQLKSPLTAIKWQSQLLIDGTTGKLPKLAVETAKEIEESADRMVELVSEFLNLRKLQEGKMEYSFEPTDVAESVSNIVDELKQLALHKKLALSFVNHASKTLCSVDRQKFAQVVQNIVDNSIKYTDTGSVQVHIEDGEPGLVKICVTDTGHGIDPAVIDKLFEQFVRDKKDAVAIEGTGLGLYIAKQIMEAHGGRVWAESPGKGKGSTFIIQLKTIAA